jgi:hypothetical protein
MGVARKLIDTRRVLLDQIDGKREGARRIDVVVAEYFIVLRTGFEHMRLQRDLHGDGLFLHGDRLFVFHGLDSSTGYWCLGVPSCLRAPLTAARPRLLVLHVRLLVTLAVLCVVVSMKTTRSARSQAAACGAGAGGSCGASGGRSGLGVGGTLSSEKRSILSILTLLSVTELSEYAIRGRSFGSDRVRRPL